MNWIVVVSYSGPPAADGMRAGTFRWIGPFAGQQVAEERALVEELGSLPPGAEVLATVCPLSDPSEPPGGLLHHALALDPERNPDSAH